MLRFQIARLLAAGSLSSWSRRRRSAIFRSRPQGSRMPVDGSGRIWCCCCYRLLLLWLLLLLLLLLLFRIVGILRGVSFSFFFSFSFFSFFSFSFVGQFMLMHSRQGYRPNRTYMMGQPQVEQLFPGMVKVPFWGSGAEALHLCCW